MAKVTGSCDQLRYSVATHTAADGECRTNSPDSISATNRDCMVANIVDKIDVSAAFSHVAAGDVTSFAFTRLAGHACDTITCLHYFGLVFEYN